MVKYESWMIKNLDRLKPEKEKVLRKQTFFYGMEFKVLSYLNSVDKSIPS